MTDKISMANLKNIIRNPYAWPGGYPHYFITADGAALSVESVRENFREICVAWFADDSSGGWLVAGYGINWEDSALYCEHSGKRIESAYAEDEADDIPNQDSVLLLDGNRGIYVPQAFAETMNRDHISGVSPEQWAILEAGPDHEWYWETWADVESGAVLNDPDHGEMYLHQDGDLWAIPNKESNS